MAATTSAVIGAGTAAYSIAQAEKQKREARRELQSYERQELDNVFKDMPISTIGSDLMLEQGARTEANLVDTARRFGTRGIFSAIPAIQAGSQQVGREARNYLDQQDQMRNRMIAQDRAQIRGMQENREFQDLAGIGNLMNVGNQNMQSGINLGLNSLFMGMRGVQGMGTNQTPPVTNQTTQATTPMFRDPGIPMGYDNASIYTGSYGLT